MTPADRFDRFEREIPELMDELAPTHRPDYFDDLLLATARTRQRPAWSTLERWLPMGEIARSVPRAPLPWRPILIFVVLTLIVLGGVLAVAGSAPRIPAPFGPAVNGSVVFSSADGDIVSADPATGELTTIIGGSDLDTDPWFSSDGTRFAFDRRANERSGLRALYIADGDGSNVRPLLEPAAEIDWFDWSPDGSRFVLSRVDDPYGIVRIVDADDGTATTFDVAMSVFGVTWRPNGDQLIVTAETSGPDGMTHGFYLVNADGTGLSPIVASSDAINEPSVSPDGTLLAYSTWSDGAEGRTHVIDIDTGVESGVDFAPAFEFNDLTPVFSPDGTKLMVHRSDEAGYRLTIVPVDGRGPVVGMGAHHPDMTNGALAGFSPDGTKVLATYQNDGTTALLDTVTGESQAMPWPIQSGSQGTWQRLAP